MRNPINIYKESKQMIHNTILKGILNLSLKFICLLIYLTI